MTIDELLAQSDPARHLPEEVIDPRSGPAVAMLTRITADSAPERSATSPSLRRRRLRRTVVAGVLAGAAATFIVAAPMPWDRGGSGLTARAYAVTRGGDGVSVTVHWSELSDPRALQAALDRADAHVRVFVRSSPQAPATCLAPRNTVSYSEHAVEWRVNGTAATRPSGKRGASDQLGFKVRPRYFPPNGTFVVSVVLAPARATGGSPAPLVFAINSFMVVGAVPSCAP